MTTSGAFLAIAIATCVQSGIGAQPIAVEFASYSDSRRDARVDLTDDFDASVKEVRYLNQGWSPAHSMQFYRLPQGSKLIPYAWFLALEQSGSETAFADPTNMNRYRYLALKANEHNQDGLPIGFVREPMQPGDPLKTDWLGLTCSACHTAEIRHGNIAYRIDGGPALADHDTFLLDLTAAMKATLDQPAKFERFATKVLEGKATLAATKKLASDLRAHHDFRQAYNLRNKTTVQYGHGRLDAFGRIMNEVLVRHIHVNEPDQAKSANAPVSYPFLWGITRHDRVQWNGIANNTKIGIGPLGRNVGEVLGVFGEVEVPSLLEGLTDLHPGFKSSVRFRNLLRLEDTIASLKAPRWEEAFGKLDDKKTKAGKELFDLHCLKCHDPKETNGFVRTTLTPLADVGTDPSMAKNFADRMGQVGNMRGRITKQKSLGLDIGRFKGKAPAGALLIGVVGRTVLRADPREFEDHANVSHVLKNVRDVGNLLLGRIARLNAIVEDLESEPFLAMTGNAGEDLLKYRGRPLEGIWATAPYLHNGSVPNLDELLQPAAKRSPNFRVGSREFDIDKVGFKTDKGFEFDVSLPGNSNRGHEYGIQDMSDPEKRAALLEYLKSL